jgi:hypothetical protein
MGFLWKFAQSTNRGNGSGSLTEGGHKLQNSQALSATDPNAVSPMNPGSMENIRSTPIVTEARTFNEEEANALCLREALSANLTRHTKRAFKALSKQESHDASVQVAYRGYQGAVAKNELRKVDSNARHVQLLHSLTGGYARIGATTQSTMTASAQRVAEFRARLLGVK